jgi:hypothetical protein
MSDDGPEWFAPKRYGLGSGLPISWQGWALSAGFALIAGGLAWMLRDRPLVMWAVLTPVIATFLLICAKTTRGGWRWRWGETED